MEYKVELPDGSEIVLLYTKKFDWKDSDKHKSLGGAPYQGRIYRALKTQGDPNYYIHLELPIVPGEPRIEGIRVTSLAYDTPEWSCSFEEINDDNIVDFDINSEDYQKIGKWLENKQQDLIDRLFNPSGIDVVASQTDPVMNGEMEGNFMLEADEARVMDLLQKSLIPYDNKCMEAIQWIGMRDPFALQAFTYILTEYVNFLTHEDEGHLSPLKRDISTSDKLGKTANVAYLLESLDTHLRAKQDSKGVVFRMILPMIFELMRQELKK